jgi:hypothetical protein
MALNNPYTSNQHDDINHVNEDKKFDDRLASTSVFPLIKQPFEDSIDVSNQIITTNDVLSGKNSFSPISSDVNSTLFNQQNHDLLPTSSNNVNHSIIAVNKQKIEYNGSFVSHIPNMSSSSSSSSIPALNEQTIVKFQAESIKLDDDPRTRSIVIGKETFIEIDREQSGLGLSVVGGSDTQLVNITFLSKNIRRNSFLLF